MDLWRELEAGISWRRLSALIAGLSEASTLRAFLSSPDRVVDDAEFGERQMDLFTKGS